MRKNIMEKDQPHLRLANTLSREVEEFNPISYKEVGLYTCGPTVYGRAHIGNLRAYIHGDVVKRSLQFLGYKVKHVMNITDVGHLKSDADEGADKVQESARREHTTAWVISQRYTDIFLKDVAKLNIMPPDVVCKATDHIPEQIELVKKLETNGYTYITSDGVYYDTSKFPDYEKLAKLDIKGLRAGKRIDMGEKRNKTDFALWKFTKPDEKRDMEWDSPWGKGFPGWHLECSAMSMKYLGDQFDIHTGGIDHIPIHHTNEIAQSEGATGKKPFVRYWLHSEFLLTKKGEKMSKSLGNIVDLDTLQELGVEPLAFRYFCLGGSYGTPLRLGEESLKGAQISYSILKETVLSLGEKPEEYISADLSDKAKAYASEFVTSISDNLNTPKALATLWALLKDKDLSNKEKYLLAINFDRVLGLGLKDLQSLNEEIPQSLKDLASQRDEARKSKDWQGADRLRVEIENAGYQVFDTKEGPLVKKKK